MSTIVSVRLRLVQTNRREWVKVALATGGLLLALLAQRTIFNGRDWIGGAILYGVALVLLLRVWATDPAAAVPVNPADQTARRAGYSSRVLLALPAALFAVLAFLSLGRNEFTPVGTSAWLTSLVLFLLAFSEGTINEWAANSWRHAQVWTRLDRVPLRISWVTVAFAVIFAVGAFLYLFRLADVPAEMTSDHAEKILDTYDVLQGQRPIFFGRNTGREPIQFYLNAAVVASGIAPLGHLALKTVTALLGLLTVPGVYLLARELFDEETGLLAAFFCAVSVWPVTIAAVGLRFPLAPVFVAPAMFFLIRGLRRVSRNDFLLAGLFLGIGLNGYSPFRMAPLVALAFVGMWLVFGKNVTWENRRELLFNTVLMISVMVLVFIPLLRYSVDRPEMFLFRAASRLTSTEQPIQGNPLLIFLDNTWRALLMFNVRGDVVWVNSIPGWPIVDYITGALILLGTGYGLFRLIRHRELYFLLIFVAIFILLLPSTLSLAFPEENPSVVRAGGAIPFVMILAALPLAAWWRQLRGVGSRGLAVLVLVILCFWVAKINFDRYFITYDLEYRNSAWNSSEIAKVMNEFATTLGDEKHAYLISAPHWVDHRAVGMNMGKVTWDNRIMAPDQLRVQAKDPAAKLYVVKSDDEASLKLLRELYPKGVTREYKSRTPSRDFYTFYAPAAE